MRIFGKHDQEIDEPDEKPLTKEEIWEYNKGFYEQDKHIWSQLSPIRKEYYWQFMKLDLEPSEYRYKVYKMDENFFNSRNLSNGFHFTYIQDHNIQQLYKNQEYTIQFSEGDLFIEINNPSVQQLAFFKRNGYKIVPVNMLQENNIILFQNKIDTIILEKKQDDEL